MKPVFAGTFNARSFSHYLIASSETSRPETKLSERRRDAIQRRGKRTYRGFTKT